MKHTQQLGSRATSLTHIGRHCEGSRARSSNRAAAATTAAGGRGDMKTGEEEEEERAPEEKEALSRDKHS